MQTIRQQAKPRKQNPVLVQSVVSLHKFCFWIVAVGGCSLSSTNIVYPQISNLVWQLVPINFNSEFSPIPCSTRTDTATGSSLAAGSSWKQKLSWGRVIWQHIGNSHGRQARLLATSCRMAIGLGSPETIGQKNSATCFPASCTLSCSCSFCIILVYVRRNTRIQKDLHWRSDVSKVCYFCYWQCQETSWGLSEDFTFGSIPTLLSLTLKCENVLKVQKIVGDSIPLISRSIDLPELQVHLPCKQPFSNMRMLRHVLFYFISNPSNKTV